MENLIPDYMKTSCFFITENTEQMEFLYTSDLQKVKSFDMKPSDFSFFFAPEIDDPLEIIEEDLLRGFVTYVFRLTIIDLYSIRFISFILPVYLFCSVELQSCKMKFTDEEDDIGKINSINSTINIKDSPDVCIVLSSFINLIF